MISKLFLGASILTLSQINEVATVPKEIQQPKSKPNVIVIVADDLGYADVGCFGSKKNPTPNIDQLANSGIRFTDGYVTCSVCAPSRCGLLTGSYNQRYGIQWNPDRNFYKIPDEQKVLPEIFKNNGYKTAVLGKWNIARDPKTVCDTAYSVMDWGGDYFEMQPGVYAGVNGISKEKFANKELVWGDKGEYLTDRLGRQTIEFIDKNKNEPFFVYLGFNAPHSPWQAKNEYRSRVASIEEDPLKVYYAMIGSVDENIGKITECLKKNNLIESTVIVFISDNGFAQGGPNVSNWQPNWTRGTGMGSAGILNGHKGTFYEGGIRVPFIINYPKLFKPSQVYSQPVSSMDIFSTVSSLANIQLPKANKSDGVDLVPYLTGRTNTSPHDTLFWFSDKRGALRNNDWKLVIFDSDKNDYELFNLKSDISEKVDLRITNPQLADALYKNWQNWCAKMPAKANPANKGNIPKVKRKKHN